ncbi:MAG TPA: PAS domain S-box protein [Candidatus Acidoferrales bacterium]|nr:PAS domain S-box protein [Candidatus Acidoferrales bacterium]
MHSPLPGELRDRIRRLEKEAQTWKQRHELLLDGLAEAVLIHEAGGRLVAVNPAAARLTGFSHQQLLAMNFRQLLTPESWTRILGLMDQPRFSTEGEMVAQSGAVIGVELRAAVARLADGSVTVQYAAHETAPRRRVEEALRHSDSRFRLMAKNLTEMALTYDMDRRLTFANAAAQTLTGYSVAELEQAQFICWVHPEDRDRMLGHWERLFEGKSFLEEEYRLITKDGRMKWVESSWGPMLDDAGSQVGVQGHERDVTGRRMAEETWRQSEHRLRVNEERYRSLFEDSPFPMWEEDFSGVKQYVDDLRARGITDFRVYLNQNRQAAMECVRRVKLLDVNRAARQFYGVEEKEELLGDLTTLFDDRAYENFCEEIAVLAENNSTYQAELQVRRIRGDDRTVNMIVSLASSSRSDWSRVVVSFFDITDRKRLEEQLLQSQKLESLGRLAGGIAHDFNNLLMVIAGYSDLLLGSLDNPERLRHGLMEIKGAGERGADLTQQLLAFSRKQMTQPRVLSLNAVIEESKGLLQRVIGEDIRLVIALDSAAWAIKADRGQMHQVLMNLVVNGRQAMPDGGTLTISTGNVYVGSDLREEPEGANTNPYLRLRIRDTGVGMDEQTRQHVFEPFFTTKGSRKGTGLGLATVFGIVTQSGGFIFVDSEPGHGATFSVYFPRSDAPATGDVLGDTPRQALRGSGTVLVVEDQDEVRLLTCAVLRDLGFEVIEASDGMEAMLVSVEYKKTIRLLVTDVIMPGINGRELAVRLAPSRPEMKVIYMSGYTDRIMSADGVLDSSVAYLQKPFSPEMLIQMVQRVLPAQ